MTKETFRQLKDRLDSRRCKHRPDRSYRVGNMIQSSTVETPNIMRHPLNITKFNRGVSKVSIDTRQSIQRHTLCDSMVNKTNVLIIHSIFSRWIWIFFLYSLLYIVIKTWYWLVRTRIISLFSCKPFNITKFWRGWKLVRAKADHLFIKHIILITCVCLKRVKQDQQKRQHVLANTLNYRVAV